MSSLFRPIEKIISFNSRPALPTNGSPWRSSSFPGASPIKSQSESLLPHPKTVWVLFLCKEHFVQFFTSDSNTFQSPLAFSSCFERSGVRIAGRSYVFLGIKLKLRAEVAFIGSRSSYNSARGIKKEKTTHTQEYSQVGMVETVTPSEGTLVTCSFCYIMSVFHYRRYCFFSRRRG